LRRSDGLGDGIVVVAVAPHRPHAPVQLGGESTGAVDVGIEDDHAHARRRQSSDGGAPEPPGAAGDDGGTPLQLHQASVASAAARSAARMPW
jgi:hypothetical protein